MTPNPHPPMTESAPTADTSTETVCETQEHQQEKTKKNQPQLPPLSQDAPMTDDAITVDNTPARDATSSDNIPLWEECVVDHEGKKGPMQMSAIRHPWCPGLAVTMAAFGVFRTSHVVSGRAIGGKYSRMDSAALELVEWFLIGHANSVNFGGDWQMVRDALLACGANPVPFADATSTGIGGSRRMTVLEWLQITRGNDLWDEFPWEGDDAPGCKTETLLKQCRPSAPPTQTPDSHP